MKVFSTGLHQEHATGQDHDGWQDHPRERSISLGITGVKPTKQKGVAGTLDKPLNRIPAHQHPTNAEDLNTFTEETLALFA